MIQKISAESRTQRQVINRIRMALLCAVLVCVLLPGRPVSVQAAAGRIYACTIHPCYRHPVTGTIEDSGGEAAYATGQGMVEGCVGTEGMFEVTDDGKMYVTFRLSLVDYTSDHAFQVQSWGEEAWSDPAVGITGEGSDTNGKTWDITMEVPSEQCVVRGSMMVTPMGRRVVYYFYPDNFTEGDADGANGMKAAMVTKPSGSSEGQSLTPVPASGSPSENGTSGGTEAGSSGTTNDAAAGTPQADTAAGVNAQASDVGAGASGAETQTSGGTEQAAGVTESAVDTRAGLKLSTETGAGEAGKDGTAEEAAAGDGETATAKRTVGEAILINVVSGVLIGGILMAAGAAVWYVLRKKQNVGLKDPDEYDDLYQ